MTEIPARLRPYFEAVRPAGLGGAFRWRCKRCGALVLPSPLGASSHLEAHIRAAERDEPAEPCKVYRPDHNSECLNCDEWYDAHTPEAVAAGEALERGECPYCGRLLSDREKAEQFACNDCTSRH